MLQLLRGVCSRSVIKLSHPSFPYFSLLSKAARRKKLAEAEKLPEVSKDIFYDVAVDLKEVFGSTLTTVKGKRDVSWDKKEEAGEENNEQSQTPEGDTDMQSGLLSLATPEKVESTGFKFSFFGADTDTVTDANAEKGVKLHLFSLLCKW